MMIKFIAIKKSKEKGTRKKERKMTQERTARPKVFGNQICIASVKVVRLAIFKRLYRYNVAVIQSGQWR